ncbi:sulfotransferase family protein [Nonomuraea sp. B12E4]|uniref:sulfotransferase family protein n=1 Tax=Nonomuraea sp. B12E4 TaxID=3153564 RepID=UPI00325E6E87
MLVIGAGFGRTGTLSLKIALERLGFGPCHHMTEVIDNPAQVHRWLAVAEGRETNLDAALSGYNSCTDWPAAAYWRELAARYPDAKVILTVRDPDRWLASMNATIFQAAKRGSTWPGRTITRISSLMGTDLAAFTKLTRLAVQERVFAGQFDPSHALKTFAAHIEEVKATIPPDRLLVFDVKQGWDPLCTFLSTPPPPDPFPRANDAATFNQHSRSAAGLLFRRSR